MKVVVLANIRKKCHIWAGRVSGQGYPIRGGNTNVKVLHREVYAEANGGIPKGKHIHHLCENKRCLNPKHLVALTPKQHRAAHSRWKETCPSGHPRTPENTYRYGKTRRCRVCEIKATRAKRFVERYQRGVQI